MGAVDSIIVSIAVPRPIDTFFTYLAPRDWAERLVLGAWVKIPFGKSSIHGFVVEPPKELSELPAHLKKENLKSILEVGELGSQVPHDVFKLCLWAAKYYAAPLGEVLHAASPPAAMGLKSKKSARLMDLKVEAATPSHPLTPPQLDAVRGLEDLRQTNVSQKVALLHGVTGSGKTEIYIELAKKCLSEGKGVILLVPEIALTSQLHDRLKKGLGEFVASWHSAMPAGQRRDQTHALVNGEIRVVVGARSAVFAPVQNLGLIIVDEEHDATYKQEDRVRYNARDLAMVRGKESGSLVILGSATPSIETLERVRENKYAIFKLSERIAPGGMPKIEITDLAESEPVEGIQAHLAKSTLQAIQETLAAGHQAMIFLNRRGFAAFLLCQDCDHVSECPQCSISLTVHKKSRQLRCHVCGHIEAIPDFCEKCQSKELLMVGAGTESLEEELPKLLPDVKILRLDRDIITSGTRLEKTLNAFRNGEAQILLGTQMLVKGHDFPKVTLVVVVLADALFRFPDFRAPERALQVLTQVSGRAGRAELPGRVILQTYQPEHPVIQVLLKQMTVEAFLENERELRQALQYPPFGRLVRLRLESSEQSEAKDRAQWLAKLIGEHYADLQILGPSEAFLERAKGIYRWDILIKAVQVSTLQKAVMSAKDYAQKQKWSLLVDIDPYGVG
jgi:primosomal protein N' (replication factor Y)